ncbi:MAG: AAA family ATPase [Christensenellales bacterium]|jgi:hypothetical protein
MKLISLDIDHFKGIRALHLAPSGSDLTIYGDNATGKTTVMDAWCWLLTGKDSAGRTTFDIKPLAPDGSVADHGVQTRVIATIEHDGQTHTIAKGYAEKWVRKAGSAAEVMDGHETTCVIDGLPVKIGEFAARLHEMIPDDTLRILSSPMYFCQGLSWQARRKILFAICGEVSDADLAGASPEYADIMDGVRQHGLDRYRKMLASKRAKLNDDLKMLPIRIDEATRSLIDTGSATAEETMADLGTLRARDHDLARRLAQSDRDATADIERRAAALDLQLRELTADQDRYDREHRRDLLVDLQGELRDAERSTDNIDADLRAAESTRTQMEASLERTRKWLEDLRTTWDRVHDRQPAVDTKCPTCGQPLPADQVDQAVEAYNLDKARRLADITAEGEETARKVADLEARIARTDADIQRLTAEAKQTVQRCGEIKAQLDAIPEAIATMPGYAERHAELMIAKESAQAQLDAARRGAQGINAEVMAEQRTVRDAIRDLTRRLADLDANANTRARIADLHEEHKRTGQELERIDRRLHLCDQLTRAKVDLIEDRVNGMFRLARWKLFDQLINGGLVDTCEATYNGVPYGNLNRAAQINVGIDIINTLSRHYGLTAPVFVDNAEAVTDLEPADGQVIRLVVSEADKALRIEGPAPVASGEIIRGGI